MPPMVRTTNATILFQAWHKLQRRHKVLYSKIASLWRSFDEDERVRCVEATGKLSDPLILKMPDSKDPKTERSSENILSDMDLRDLTEPDSDAFLSHFTFRATATLNEQWNGVNDMVGDYDRVMGPLDDLALACEGAQQAEGAEGSPYITTMEKKPYPQRYLLFVALFDKSGLKEPAEDLERLDAVYAMPFVVLSTEGKDEEWFEIPKRSGLLLPVDAGTAIVTRQMRWMDYINTIIDNILETASKSADRDDEQKDPSDATAESLSQLRIVDRPTTLSFAEFSDNALGQSDALQSYADVLFAEPDILANAVEFWCLTRAELFAKLGRNDKVKDTTYSNGAFLDTVHNAVKAAANWKYICGLMDLLEPFAIDRVYRTIILQEVANVCQLEYDRLRPLLRGHLQSQIGISYVKQLAKSGDVVQSEEQSADDRHGKPVRIDWEYYYMAQLCQMRTPSEQAATLVTKIADCIRLNPNKESKSDTGEDEVLGDIAAIVQFVNDIRRSGSLPSHSQRKSQTFITRAKVLEEELDAVKPHLDQSSLTSYIVPWNNLREPGLAKWALDALDQFTLERVGFKIESLYDGVIEESLALVAEQCHDAKAQLQPAQPGVPTSQTAPEKPEKFHVEQRREKEKTRPSNPPTIETAETLETAPPEESGQTDGQTFNVSASTFETFRAFFQKSEARGSIAWTAFESAMAELGFAVRPRYGSVYTFLPPESMGASKSLTVHRPHKSQIEPWKLLVIAQQLRKVYGWAEETFVLASKGNPE